MNDMYIRDDARSAGVCMPIIRSCCYVERADVYLQSERLGISSQTRRFHRDQSIQLSKEFPSCFDSIWCRVGDLPPVARVYLGGFFLRLLPRSCLSMSFR